jgi:hypothetical protein
MNTTTDRDDQHDLSENAWKARMMALPLVAWQDGVYRIVLWYDESDDEIRRTPERLTGHDLLGNERWEPLDNASIQWQYLAHQLAVTVAPWPTAAPAQTPDDVRNALQTEYDKAIMTIGQYRDSNDQIVENASAVALVLEALAAQLDLSLSPSAPENQTHEAGRRAGRFALGAVADDHLRAAYTSLNWAYNRSENSAVDRHILTAQEALAACALTLGLDPLRDRVSDTLSDTDEQTPPAWPPIHKAVIDALLEIAVEAVRMRGNLTSESAQVAVQLELAALNRVAKAAGIANLEERATEALRRAQQENIP